MLKCLLFSRNVGFAICLMVPVILFEGGAEAQKMPKSLLIGTGAAGGSFYVIGATVSRIMNREIKGITWSARTGGGPAENPLLIAAGELLMGFASLKDVKNARPKLKDLKKSRFRIVFASAQAIQQMFVPKNAPYRRVQDLKGKRIGCGALAAIHWPMNKDLFKALGMTPKDFDCKNLSPKEASAAVKDGSLEGALFAGAYPHPGILNVKASPRGGKLLRMTRKEVNKVIKAFPIYNPVTIPAGAYSDEKEDIPSFALLFYFLVLDTFPEKLAYQFTKNMVEHYDEIVKGYKGARWATVKNTLAGKDQILLHPGAARYLQERGFLK